MKVLPTTCSCCGIRLDKLSQHEQQTNFNLCMWCESSPQYKEAFSIIDELIIILERFIEDYRKQWKYNEFAKALMGNIILNSIKELSSKFSIEINLQQYLNKIK